MCKLHSYKKVHHLQNKFLNNKVNLAVFLLKQGNNFKLIVGNYINADAVEKLKKKV